MLLIHSLAMPYKEYSHNLIDSFLIANMAVMNGITIYNSSLFSRDHNIALASSIQLVLKAFPLLFALLYCGYTITKKCLKCHRRAESDNDYLVVDYSFNYPE